MAVRPLRALGSILVILTAAGLAACATPGPAPVEEARSVSSPIAERSPSDPAQAGSAWRVKRVLYRQHDRWRGTRYRLGGMGADGFDCSGLTYVLYRDAFGRRLPRTTGGQVEFGHAVSRADLAPGDLVFFKTGVFQRHVGVYVEDGLFLHASRQDGVRLSNLRRRYWRERYWQARRASGI